MLYHLLDALQSQRARACFIATALSADVVNEKLDKRVVSRFAHDKLVRGALVARPLARTSQPACAATLCAVAAL